MARHCDLTAEGTIGVTYWACFERLAPNSNNPRSSRSFTAENGESASGGRFARNAVVLRLLCRLGLLQPGVRDCLAATYDG